MTITGDRRTVLTTGAAMLGAALLPAAARAQNSARAHEFMVKDIVYSKSGGKERQARLYQPAGSGPFPAVLQIHGGAWNNKDRTDGQNTALDLAETVTLLNYGRVIVDGKRDVVVADERTREVYLGT